ncbi:MAG TPA: tRNA pseudouridine(38-40) synthase TruA [Acidimicrobiia bacterium]|nr:tRNA pseudouridine(38-40) synthase TruA [Acidimicrobiia bacterium]
MPTYRIDLAYDGSGFHGYAANPGVRTVQGELERGLAAVLGSTPGTVVAGRTDAGVHAWDQVVSFETDADLDIDRLRGSLSAMLGPEVVVRALSLAEDGFDARFSAVSRTYRYFVDDRVAPNPLHRHSVWHVGARLDADAMAKAAKAFVGEHDFASFCRAAEGKTTIRRVLSASWWRDSDGLAPRDEPAAGGGGLLVFEVTANAFCHQMVRSLVALSVEIGRGRVPVSAIPTIFEARDRNAARGAAPPHGLILWRVEY